MMIKSIEPVAVRVPTKRVGQFTRARRTHAMRTIVIIETTDGTIGVGETRGLEAARIIRERFAPLVTGTPARDIAQVRARCVPALVDYGYPEQLVDLNAFAAIDMALWDIKGKRCGLPVYKLLGGAVRTGAEFVAYEYTIDPEEGHAEKEVPQLMADRAQMAIEETGCRYFEFKIGVYSVACDIATIHAVRDRLGPDVEIGVDANMALDFDAAYRLISGVVDANVSNFEEPVATLAEMDRLANTFGVRVSSHCTNLDSLLHYPGVSGVVGEPHAAGGLVPMAASIARTVACNRRFWFRSVWELGISWAAMCHMGVAVPGLERPSQSLFNLIEDDLILEQTWDVVDGMVIPPDVPGLGVTLDQEALLAYRLE